MVISPKDLTNNGNTQDKERIDELEKIIDKTLTQRFDGTSAQYTFPTDVTPRLRRSVLKKYRAAGWDVKCTSTDEYVFQPKKPRIKDEYDEGWG